MISAYIFMAFTFTGFALAIFRGPFWGLLVYMNIYFNGPTPYVNWWAEYLPSIRWSLISIIVLCISFIIHRKEDSRCKFYSIKWAIVFLILTVMITLKGTIVQSDANNHTYLLVTYCITVFFILRSIKTHSQYRLVLLFIIAMAGNLSLKAYQYGERINVRLENIGTFDSIGSNEFALLLAGIIPFTLPFIISGKTYERIICFLTLPFIINAMILCNSRGAFVAMALSVIMVFVFLADWKIRKKIIIVVLCVVPIFTYLADEYVIERLSSLLGAQDAVSVDTEMDTLSSGRTAIWRYGIEMVQDYPFGAGPNSFKHLARFYMPDEILTYHPGDKYGVRSAHNNYLQILVEQGMFGLAIFLLMCAHTMKLLYECLKIIKKIDLTDSFWKYNIVALGLSNLSILFGGLFASRIYYEFFWWQIAFSVISYSFVKIMEQNALNNPVSSIQDSKQAETAI